MVRMSLIESSGQLHRTSRAAATAAAPAACRVLHPVRVRTICQTATAPPAANSISSGASGKRYRPMTANSTTLPA